MNPLAIAQAIVLLEPLAKEAFLALVHKFHTHEMTAADFIAQAEKIITVQPTSAVTGIPHP